MKLTIAGEDRASPARLADAVSLGGIPIHAAISSLPGAAVGEIEIEIGQDDHREQENIGNGG